MTLNENVSFTDYASGIWLLVCSKLTIKNNNTLQFTDVTLSSHLFDVVVFLLSSLVTGASFMSISLLVLEI